MNVASVILVWVAMIGVGLWLLSFWARWLAVETGVSLRAFLARPLAGGLAPYKRFWPFVSLGFYRFLWSHRLLMEFVIAMIVFVMVTRAGSAFLATARAVARSAA